LKAWQHDISEGREQVKEVRNSCEETFSLIHEILLRLDSKNNNQTLGHIDITKHLLNIKENEEREHVEIS
jgi:hypothetical protein